MNLKRLLCQCECGSYAHPFSFWLSDQKQLVVGCTCISCERHFNSVFKIGDLFKACPIPDIKAIEQAINKEIETITTPQELTGDDIQFLKAMRITS